MSEDVLLVGLLGRQSAEVTARGRTEDDVRGIVALSHCPVGACEFRDRRRVDSGIAETGSNPRARKRSAPPHHCGDRREWREPAREDPVRVTELLTVGRRRGCGAIIERADGIEEGMHEVEATEFCGATEADRRSDQRARARRGEKEPVRVDPWKLTKQRQAGEEVLDRALAAEAGRLPMPLRAVLSAPADMAVGDRGSAREEVVREGIERPLEADAVGAVDVDDDGTAVGAVRSHQGERDEGAVPARRSE
nr:MULTISPECIES: hypothetical protein [unclassified Rathayibacter]